MVKLRAIFEIDSAMCFDRLKALGGNTEPLATRIIGALLTGNVSFAEAICLSLYGITLVSCGPVDNLTFKIQQTPEQAAFFEQQWREAFASTVLQPGDSEKTSGAATIGDGIAWPEQVPCCTPDYPAGCVCAPMERALRGWIAGGELPAMTAEQREYCLNEIGKVEGYTRAKHENETDGELARTVLSAWTDYCRDKGLM